MTLNSGPNHYHSLVQYLSTSFDGRLDYDESVSLYLGRTHTQKKLWGQGKMSCSKDWVVVILQTGFALEPTSVETDSQKFTVDHKVFEVSDVVLVACTHNVLIT